MWISGIKNGLATTFLQIAIFCFFWIIVLTVMTVAGWKNFGYWFWGLECMVLSGLLLSTMFMVVMGENHWQGLDDCLALGLKCFKRNPRDEKTKTEMVKKKDLKLSICREDTYAAELR